MTHDEAINILRNAGAEVTLTVKHYRAATPFLLKNLRQFIPESTTKEHLGSLLGERKKKKMFVLCDVLKANFSFSPRPFLFAVIFRFI